MKPLLLDLFCGAGGAGMGYHRAGFRVIGLDNRPQKNYPFEFVQADALEFASDHGGDFDVIHASPPCQRYSVATKPHGSSQGHPDLVGPVRKLLVAIGRVWVIENVPGAPLVRPVTLCGMMFGLKVYRHRLFESSHLLMGPSHHRHTESTGAHRGYSRGHGFVCVAGNNFQPEEGASAMGIDWMGSRKELAQAIPPAYTEYVGRQLLRAL